MAHLKVKSQGKIIYDSDLIEGKVYTVGRKEGCEIFLQGEKGISREHIKISYNGSGWQVEVLSRFGNVYYRGEALPQFTLEPGTIFTLLNFEFEYSEASSGSSLMPQSINQDSENEDPFEKTVVGKIDISPTIKIYDSSGTLIKSVVLENASKWIAGRDSSADIQIADARVSRRQFEIIKNNGQYQIIDLGSINGTLLNQNKISSTEHQTIYSGDVISVLEYQLNFEIIDKDFKNRISNLPALPHVESGEQYPILSTENMPLVPTVGQPNFPVAHSGQSNMIEPYHPQQNQGLTPFIPPIPVSGVPQFPHDGMNVDKKKNEKKRLIIMASLAILILGGAYYIKMQDEQKSSKPIISDPFAQLSPEKQEAVKGFYSKSKYYLQQEKWELARNEIMKMKEIINSYMDSEEVLKFVEVQYQTIRDLEDIERRKQEAQAIEEKIQTHVEKCQKLINPNVTMEEMDTCLTEAKSFNPEHPQIINLTTQVQNLLAEREMKQQQKKEYLAKVSQLRAIYNRAIATEKSDQLAAIDIHSKVVESSLPDPEGLKRISNSKIQQLKDQINSKTLKLQKDAEEYAHNNDYKSAILALRAAKKIDPRNFMLDDKISKYMFELKKQMKTLYEEGVLEENFGNVDGGENKPGAKDKWRKILELDVTDGEYYKKAYMRLKKYGAF